MNSPTPVELAIAEIKKKSMDSLRKENKRLKAAVELMEKENEQAS